MFRQLTLLLLLTIIFFSPIQSLAKEVTATAPRVVIETSMGIIKIELFDKEAPLSAENFRSYVHQGFYDGLLFHRVIPGFMIQGGGMEPGMKDHLPKHKPVPNEASNGLKNRRGTVAMARFPEIHSATSEFFINVSDNTDLDHQGMRPDLFGYAVFGKVVEGMEVADKIVAVPRTTKGMYKNVPIKDVLIIKVYEEKGK